MAYSDHGKPKKDVRMILIGGPDTGKSAVGNTILGSNTFSNEGNRALNVGYVETGNGSHNGHNITVVDAFQNVRFDKKTKAEKLREMTDVMEKILKPGENPFTVFILVFCVNERFSASAEETICLLRDCLGPSYTECCIMVLSFGDQFQYPNFEDWCRNQKGIFKDLYKACEYRAVLFCNKDNKKRKQQVDDLFKLIFNIESTNKDYTWEQFNEIKSRRQVLIQEENFRKEIQSSLDQIRKEIDDALSEISTKLESVEIFISESDGGCNVLTNFNSEVTDLKRQVDLQRVCVKRRSQYQQPRATGRECINKEQKTQIQQQSQCGQQGLEANGRSEDKGQPSSSLEEQLGQMKLDLLIGRLTDEQMEVIDEADSLFGPEWMRKFGIIIVTYGENYDEKENGPFEQWCHELVVNANENGSTNETLGHIFKRFQSRIALFKNTDKRKSQQNAQRDKILDFQESLPKSRNGRYTESNFEIAKAGRKRLILSFDKDVLEDDVRKKIENIQRDLLENTKNTKLSEQERSEKCDNLVDQVTGEITKLKNKEKGSGALQKQIESLENFKEKIRTIKDELETERYEHHLEKTRQEGEEKKRAIEDQLEEEKKKSKAIKDQLEEEKKKSKAIKDQLEEEKKKDKAIKDQLEEEKKKSKAIKDQLEEEKKKSKAIKDQLEEEKKKSKAIKDQLDAAGIEIDHLKRKNRSLGEENNRPPPSFWDKMKLW